MAGEVLISNKQRYARVLSFNNPRDIPDVGFVESTVGGAVISKTRTTTDPDTYTLTSPELVILNAYTRYPNFVAIVTSTGQQFSDIYPTYTGTIGSFTACVVTLHSDGAGLNADNTYIQFS